MIWQIVAVSILLVFYTIYIGKMIAQKKKGIQTDQIARGKKKGKLFRVELMMKIATYSVVLVEVISIILNISALPKAVRIIGIILGVAGDIIFAIAVWTMRDSWRAGIAENDKTEIVTSGIYRFSRNPAFLGFNLVYFGILLIFFNWVLFIFSSFAVIMLHLQILQEEKYLPSVFGEEYKAYKKKVCRYIGRK
ncbi:MAG TPA: isoprenylcysteine carboxyl methyltransferase [Clostridiales bacterium]|nr:isoprenylcysteine carboxyl methyltransferase [Clostridiales bacterium]